MAANRILESASPGLLWEPTGRCRLGVLKAATWVARL